MNVIHEYIDWESIWNNGIKIEEYEEDWVNEEQWKLIRGFISDDKVDMNISECEVQGDHYLMFVFSETGGQNESDTQGWSREYWFRVKADTDLMIIGCGYEQG